MDYLVHGTLYYYGLNFSYDWANTYWAVLRMVQWLLALTAFLTAANAIYVYRMRVRAPTFALAKQEMQGVEVEEVEADEVEVESVEVEEVAAPSVTTESNPGSASGLIKCSYCRKDFSQPLRILDFQAGKQSIVNTCPFCNKVITTPLPQEEPDWVKNAVQKPRETLQEREKEEIEEAAATKS